jgi:hypothetical protein
MISLSRNFLLLSCIGCATLAQSPAQDGFRTLHVDAGKVTGELRSLQGVNGAPLPQMPGLPNLVRQYRELHIDMVRTHDLMGPTDIDARFDVKNGYLAWLIPDNEKRALVAARGNKSTIFPDPSADPEKPSSYNFAATDQVLGSIRASGAEIYYRIGRSWGANIDPPADFDKYANVVKHVAMHYNQGWDHGFHFHIRYWEFWNEADGFFWLGTPQQFYLLYEKTARALKSFDPALMVGGDGLALPFNDGPYREGFLDYCAAHHVPLDFFSWHTYSSNGDPYDAARLARIFRTLLDTHGFPHAESILSEWNGVANFDVAWEPYLHSALNAAFIAAALSYMQDAPLDHAILYRGDPVWMGLFDSRGQYTKPAYTFAAMARLRSTPQRLHVEGADTLGFAALAGRSADGRTTQILITNYAVPADFKPPATPPPPADVQESAPRLLGKYKTLPPRPEFMPQHTTGYILNIDNLPWGNAAFTLERYRISATQNLELVERRSGAGGSVKLSNPLAPETIELVVLRRR